MVINELRPIYGLPKLLSFFQMPRSTYYKGLKEKEDKYKEVKQRILFLYYKSHKRKGYRYICNDLREEGIIINHKTVLKLMQSLNIKSVVRAKKYKSYKGGIWSNCEIPNILQQDFSTTKLNQKWATDVTEFRVKDTRIYLSGIMDLYNKEIIAYTIRFSPKLEMVTDMITIAFNKRKNSKNVIVHSDQGWHYKHKKYVQLLNDFGAKQSMSKKGCCLDNAVIENFWGTLKCEMFYLNKFNSVKEFVKELKAYIHYFNYERKSQVLGYCTPIEFGSKIS